MICESISKPNSTAASYSFSVRACTFMIAVTDAIHQLTMQTTRSIQFTASAIIDFNYADFENACYSFSIGILQATGLVALAILGLFEPEFSRNAIEQPCFRHFRHTTKYCTPTIGKILCAINGLTFFPCNIILGINTLIATPFKDQPENSLEESKIYFIKALVDLIAVPGGFFNEKLRHSECIQIT